MVTKKTIHPLPPPAGDTGLSCVFHLKRIFPFEKGARGIFLLWILHYVQNDSATLSPPLKKGEGGIF
jgi:hypothetical protein